MHSPKVISGNLLDATEQYIVHQCNCVTWRAAHLAQSIFEKYPYADIYSIREATAYQDEPGTIIIKGNGVDQRYVIALLGQFFPGTPRINQQKLDSYKLRKKYFYHGLLAIANIKNLQSVAFPVRIGCGAAGGNWDEYLDLINKFADAIYTDYKAETVLYDYDGK